MERSRKRMPMSQRSKGACTIAALAVGFGCAVFGVGGADGGTRGYARHLREARIEARLAGAELSHRSPEQLLLAIRPKAHAAATPAAVTQAPIATSATTPAATTTTSTVPAATTTTTTSTTPSTTTSSAASAGESASESTAPSNPVNPAATGTGTTTTGTTTTGTTTTGTTTTGTTTTGTTTTGTTTTGTTTTGTTTTGTTTTGTTTTGTTTGTTTTGTGTTTTGTTTTGTTATPDASTGENGRVPGTTSTDTTTTACHGRCESNTGSSTALPAALPSTTSSSTSTNFPLSVTAIPAVTPAATTPVNDASSVTVSPTATTPAATSTTPTATSSGSGSASGNATPLSGIISLLGSKIPETTDHLTQSSGSHRSGAALPTAATGTGTVPAGGGTGTGPAGTTGTGTGAGTISAANRTAPAHRGGRHPSTSGSALTAPFSSGVRVIDNVVKVIPTAVWIALGAAFGLMLAFAGIALRSSRRARRREKEFAAISAAALTDALTGILNRRGFTEAAERELARASRYNRPFVLAYVDVRGLKTVNDTEGHLMGDELIKTVADLMKESARADDVVGRIGGDEFALLLGEQTAESAGPVVRRIRARVAEARAAMEISVPWELTIGMASFPDDGATLEELLDLADRRLYEQRGIALR
jgi:diguanylate cyclase (GGDEF)-like protein